MPKCDRCGKSADIGALIINNRRFCRECAEEFEDIMDEFMIRWYESKLKEEKEINVDEVVDKFWEKLKSFGFRRNFIKRMVLSMILREKYLLDRRRYERDEQCF